MELNPEITRKIIERNHLRETVLSKNATKNSGFLRRKDSKQESHIRLPFSRDSDRILHSRAYTRYVDKTQVFFLVNNDHVTHRVLHVQLVSKIAKTIGRSLGLNEDLIEAISLGHDIGHVPYGHLGEKILGECCEKHGLTKFFHNVQAIQFLDVIEDKDLTIQVLDGILCHNGEKDITKLKPEGDADWDSFDSKLDGISRGNDHMPMTYEGCAVRLADTIAYLGRDLQDAIELRLLTKPDMQQFPGICKHLFNIENCDNINWIILDTLVKDVINTSYDSDEISFSDPFATCVRELKEYNYQHIYLNPKLHKEDEKIKNMYMFLFEKFLTDLEGQKTESSIFKNMLEPDWISEEYKNSANNAELVRDYLGGMTDRYFNLVFRELVLPREITSDFDNG